MKKLKFSLALFILLLSLTFSAIYGQWENLVRKDLSNWEQLNGTAPFKVEKGVITGTTVLNSPNSFLCTKAKYGNFILEFDFMADPNMNSGVQFRSESRQEYMNGRVHGYQVEIDPSDRAWTGGIYDEARRGWLYTMEINPWGKKAFRKNEWNHVRVEAIGNSLRIWVNDIPTADVIDDMTLSGFIALQVHSIGKDSSRVGEKIMWKNIRIITEDPIKYTTPYTPAIPQNSYLNNKLSDREIKDGWKLLWDGSSFEGWRTARSESGPESGWEIKDGILTVLDSKEQPKRSGDIYTAGKYGNFEMVVDFRYSKGANSGIKYLTGYEGSKGVLSSIGCEYQILDDRNHHDAKAGINGNRTLAGLYDLITPKNKRDNGAGNWNRATIIVRGSHVEHWLNGEKTVEYERGNDEWRKLVATSKFKDVKLFGEDPEGRIELQDHGNNVSFKNIKIREIK
jgi:hypothetical protein